MLDSAKNFRPGGFGPNVLRQWSLLVKEMVKVILNVKFLKMKGHIKTVISWMSCPVTVAWITLHFRNKGKKNSSRCNTRQEYQAGFISHRIYKIWCHVNIKLKLHSITYNMFICNKLHMFPNSTFFQHYLYIVVDELTPLQPTHLT